MRKTLTAVLLSGALAAGCGGCASFQIDPEETQQARTRAVAVRVADSVTATLAIVESVVETTTTLLERDAISIEKATRVRDLSQAFVDGSRVVLSAVGQALTMPSVSATAQTAKDLLDPLLEELRTSDNGLLRFAATALDAAAAYFISQVPSTEAGIYTSPSLEGFSATVYIPEARAA